jgi:hypothetical protein
MKEEKGMRFNFPKIVGRYGTFAVDTFSTLLFFAMQGRSWVLIATGLIFAAVKIWHWIGSFTASLPFIRRLHRAAWCVMAVLSIYFLITLGVAITEPEPELVVVVDESAAKLEKAVVESKAARINALVQEQTMLLSQNASLTERLTTFGQWSSSAADFRATINSNNERLGNIGAELTALYEKQSDDVRRETEAQKETKKEKDNLILTSIRNFKPIGASALLERVMPKRFTDFAIRFLFFLIGVVMEITLAFASLPDGDDEKPDKKANPQTEKETRENTREKVPTIKEITEYIEAALGNDHALLPDNEVIGIEKHQCAKYRKYLASFAYKDKQIIVKQDGRYLALFDKENMKRFIALQYNVKHKSKKAVKNMPL